MEFEYYRSIKDAATVRRMVAIPAGQFDRYRDKIMDAFGYSPEADFGETSILPVYDDNISDAELEAAEIL